MNKAREINGTLNSKKKHLNLFERNKSSLVVEKVSVPGLPRVARVRQRSVRPGVHQLDRVRRGLLLQATDLERVLQRDNLLRAQITRVAQPAKRSTAERLFLQHDVVLALEQLLRVVVLRGQVDVQRVARDGTAGRKEELDSKSVSIRIWRKQKLLHNSDFNIRYREIETGCRTNLACINRYIIKCEFFYKIHFREAW